MILECLFIFPYMKYTHTINPIRALHTYRIYILSKLNIYSYVSKN